MQLHEHIVVVNGVLITVNRSHEHGTVLYFLKNILYAHKLYNYYD